MKSPTESTARLRSAIERALFEQAATRTLLENTLRSLPADPVNAPAAEALTMLAGVGFCVLHRDRMDQAIACVRTVALGDHETSAEREALDDLLQHLRTQTPLCRLRYTHMTDKIVMRDSAEAAQYRTGLSGWVSRNGQYFGEGDQAESMARYAGCTHVACGTCGQPTPKGYTKCRGCRDLADEARFEAMPQAAWDGKAMIYSQAQDRYYTDPGEVEDYLEDGQTMADLQLVICTPNYVSPLEGDYCADTLPDDGEGELPAAVEEAMDAFNKAVAGIVLSWSPGKTRLAITSEEPTP